VSILFGFGVLYFRGEQLALEFFTGYLIEKALSVDNLFLFLVIFSRVLPWMSACNIAFWNGAWSERWFMRGGDDRAGRGN